MKWQTLVGGRLSFNGDGFVFRYGDDLAISADDDQLEIEVNYDDDLVCYDVENNTLSLEYAEVCHDEIPKPALRFVTDDSVDWAAVPHGCGLAFQVV